VVSELLTSLLTDARVERARPNQRIERLPKELGVKALAKPVIAYAKATRGVKRVLGPWMLHGFGAKLPPAKSCGELFGRFGDTPFPALRIGGDRTGIEFWLVVTSGRVITLHHDASLYEVAAKCGGSTVAAFTAELEDRGSAFDIEQLTRLQVALHEHRWQTELERQQIWAREAAKVLGVTVRGMVQRATKLPYELLHLEQEVVDELATPPPRHKRGKAEKLPPPLVEALASDARTLDLAGLLDGKLPARVAELANLEELDLSDNPRLDFEDAFEKLSVLPRLRVVKFADCRMEKLPAALGGLAALEELDLTSSLFKGPSNFFALDQVQPIVAKLPKLRVLDTSVCLAPTDFAAFIAAQPAIERLTLDSVRPAGYGVSKFTAPGSATLEFLSLGSLDIDALIDVPAARFPRLRELRLEDAWISAHCETDDWDERDRAFKARIEQLIEWLAQLPALARVDLRPKFIDIDDPPPAIAKLRLEELWLNAKRLPPWIGTMRSLRALHVRYLRQPPPPELGELSELEVLDLGGLGSDSICKPKTLPDAIGKLTKLRTLILRESLERWPETLRNCRALEELDACLGEGPPFLGELVSLRKSTGPVAELVKLPKLEALDLTGAHHVPELEHHAIRRVRWAAYDFEGDFDATLERVLALPALESLEVSCTNRATLPESLLRPPLRELDLSISNHDEPPLDLAQVLPLVARTRIESLRIFTHGRVELPESLGDITTLRSLSLWGIGIAALPASITKLANLRTLELRSTKIGAPERTRVRTPLPGCRIIVRD
jgi:Leucine-rich repeat (LRR) protein